MNSDSYLYFNIAQEIRLYINSTMKHQLQPMYTHHYKKFH